MKSNEIVHTWSNGYIKFWLYICSTWPRFLIHYRWWKVKSISILHVGWKLANQRSRALLIRAAIDTRCKHRWSKTATRSSSMWRIEEYKHLSQKKLVRDFELNSVQWTPPGPGERGWQEETLLRSADKLLWEIAPSCQPSCSTLYRLQMEWHTSTM